MQRHCEYCMHKEHSTIRMMNKEEMVGVVEGEDSSVSKEAERSSRDAW
jgi:hypothetical protein